LLILDIDGVMTSGDKYYDNNSNVVILSSAGFANMASLIREHIHIPVVDPVESAIKIAEILISMRKS